MITKDPSYSHIDGIAYICDGFACDCCEGCGHTTDPEHAINFERLVSSDGRIRLYERDPSRIIYADGAAIKIQ